MKDKFKIGDEYRDCEHGIVYVLAANMQEAAEQIPGAISISRAGIALEPKPF